MAADEIPSELHVVVLVGRKALLGALIEVELLMRTKNDYRFPIGPADSIGQLRISADQLRSYSRQINDLFAMDYIGLDAGWTGEIIIGPVGRGGIERLRQAYRVWALTGLYSSGFPADLDRLEAALTATDDRLPIEVVVEPAHKAV